MCLADTKMVPDLLLRHSCLSEVEELLDVIMRQLRHRVFLPSEGRSFMVPMSKDIDRVKLVFTRGGKLKVFKAIVALDAVDMVDLKSFGNGAVKRFPDHPVHGNGTLLFSGVVHADPTVTTAVRTRRHDTLKPYQLGKTRVRNFIRSLITGSGLPNFHSVHLSLLRNT